VFSQARAEESPPSRLLRCVPRLPAAGLGIRQRWPPQLKPNPPGQPGCWLTAGHIVQLGLRGSLDSLLGDPLNLRKGQDDGWGSGLGLLGVGWAVKEHPGLLGRGRKGAGTESPGRIKSSCSSHDNPEGQLDWTIFYIWNLERLSDLLRVTQHWPREL
jgi:hypothetical protein